MTVKDLLSRSEIFQGFPEHHLQLLLPLCKAESPEKGKVIFNQGDPGRFLYVVGEGRVALKIDLERPDGSKTGPITVASVGPRGIFGWPAIVEPHVFALSATAVEKTELVLLDGSRLRVILDRNRDMGYQVMLNVAKIIAARLADTREALVYDRSWVQYRQHLTPEKH